MFELALKNQVAVVTGASSAGGIGRAIAQRFARAGASLMLVAEGTAEQLAEAARLCEAEPGAGRIETALIDLSDPAGPLAMIALAERRLGRIDVLVNNAAIRGHAPFVDASREQFDQVIAINLAAPFFASQAAAAVMRRQGGGRIIHIASQLGHVTFPNRALYGLSKAALIHLTKTMAHELVRDRILVNAISPGPIATPAVAHRPAEELAARFDPYLPGGRLGLPEEIAETAFFLASAAPAYLIGQSLVVDGGYINH